ncbi:hypothetical protein LZ24_00973 [Desulfobotulus alkaliphilus]|uniref:Uncharacterized protein n=1 Tax=Desulfobotulus alkaliphilus TaxID=622671 RepID=A0A562S141_9BACT|nr:hypothetical protein [Desulfobotulus alkaliphilus]TWI74370.1 hypothetical protein LZ24_00973 [Desulfobotulus alkaliphilus]
MRTPEKFEALEFWRKAAKNWPELILCKDADRGMLSGFPYKRAYFRNLITGKAACAGPETFRIGRLLAVEKESLIQWLADRTKEGGA